MNALEQRSTTPALLDYPEAQRYLGGISRSTLKALIGGGQLPSVAIGRRRLLRVCDLDAFIAKRTAPGNPEAA